MSHIDSAPEGGKYRAFAASGLGGTAGAWGLGDLLCVKDDGTGHIALAGLADAEGVILTTEGKTDNTHANYKVVVGGKKYTVFTRGVIITEVDGWTVPAGIAVGDKVYAAAAGAATVTPAPGAIYLGKVVLGEGSTGMFFFLDVGGSLPHGGLDVSDLKFLVINGGAAGAHAVAGIAATDTLLAVLRLRKSKNKSTIIAGGAAGDHAVAAIVATDVLESVLYINVAGTADVFSDLTAEFTAGAAKINNVGGTDTTGGALIVTWRQTASDEVEDLVAEFTITGAGAVENAGHTDTTDDKLLFIWAAVA